MNTAKQLPITTYGMDILRKKTGHITQVNTNLINLIQNMFYTMNKASGIGLAAPQINLGISLAVIDISEIEEYKKIKPLTLINPEILDSNGSEVSEEGCLSIPDVHANVQRPKDIFLKFHDLDLNEVKIELSGFIARVAQHEIDHLNGKLFIDYLDETQKKEIKRNLLSIKKGKLETSYPLHIHSKSEALKL